MAAISRLWDEFVSFASNVCVVPRDGVYILVLNLLGQSGSTSIIAVTCYRRRSSCASCAAWPGREARGTNTAPKPRRNIRCDHAVELLPTCADRSSSTPACGRLHHRRHYHTDVLRVGLASPIPIGGLMIRRAANRRAAVKIFLHVIVPALSVSSLNPGIHLIADGCAEMSCRD